MCQKYMKMPIMCIVLIIFIIILVVITGVTLTSQLDQINIFKLNEKVRSDSANQNNEHYRGTTLDSSNINYRQNTNNNNNNNNDIDDYNNQDGAAALALEYYGKNHPKNIFRKDSKHNENGTSPRSTNNSIIILNYDINQINNNNNGNDNDSNINKIFNFNYNNNTNNNNSYNNNFVGNSQKVIRGISEKSELLNDNINITNENYILNLNIESVRNESNLNNIFKIINISIAETVVPSSLNSSILINNNNDNDNMNLTDEFHLINNNNNETINNLNISLNHQNQNITPILNIDDKNPNMIDFEKREIVKQMMKHAWDNYKLYAWGKNELRPLSQRAHSGSIFGSHELGATIIDGLDTLFIMGMNNEYEEGKDWIARKFSLDNITAELSIFETNIRFIGGLLTLYAFTGDQMYKEKAQHVADKLLPAFQTPTGIPYALVNTKTGISKNYGWASGGSSILSEFGTLHLEFSYLSDITGNPLYKERVQNIRQVLKEIEKPKGLYPNYLNPKTGKWGQQHMSLGALGDSFYEYLLKAWIQSGQTDEEARQMYDDAMKAIVEKMVRTSNSGLIYVSDLKFDRLEHKMDHLACFAGGLFAMGANSRQNDNTEKFWEVGKGLTNTCHESYDRTPTKLGPEAFRFTDAIEARALKAQEKYYILRPETYESYFILWRLTHDQKYRDWGWEAIQALEKHCRTPHGYCGLKNVYMEDPQKDDVQQSFFLAESLKYLYLLFSDDSLLSLDEWVFNTEAHPLPIKGANILYRQASTPSTAP
ncbi:mannosyl-oligosaccharide alpha-1,2-mannosidase IA isoform X1 [Condylostylus longicornis]|uniref:mannosyl-oligosaccharide alpha-1,2-mannosidase IA isoform X1 n=1 Tax=Condylostylus longicornis TaxID=2530218 RepID=UPI00244E3080|nr:mannosyl-oligosaccharide alpha-1,2-mannosidase IA isoform X1 [Condylostylus longicornis]